MVRSNIPSAPVEYQSGVTATAGEVNYNDVTTAGTVEATKAVILDGSKDAGIFGILSMAGLTLTQVARTATAAGDGTGLIADGGLLQNIAVTAKTGDANGIIVLPTPTPGTVLVMYCGATGYELRSDTPASVEIGGGTGASAESAIPAESVAVLFCITATQWVGLTITDATLAVVEAAA